MTDPQNWVRTQTDAQEARAAANAAAASAAQAAEAAANAATSATTAISAATAGSDVTSVDHILDATDTGKQVLLSPDPTAARATLGAGTSSLTLGTTAGTAKPGDWLPLAQDITDATATSRALLTAQGITPADERAAARQAIAAASTEGTDAQSFPGGIVIPDGSLPVTAVSGLAAMVDAAVANRQITYDALPPGTILGLVDEAAPRPTQRQDLTVFWRSQVGFPAAAFPGDINLLGTAASSAVVLFNDTFTGADDALWDAANWTTGLATAAAAATLQNNRGRLRAGNLTNYTGVITKFYAADKLNAELSGLLSFLTVQDGSITLALRAAGPPTAITTAYLLQLSRPAGGLVRLVKRVAGDEQTLAELPLALPTGVSFGFRFRTVGDDIRGKVWDTAAPQPQGWALAVTDTVNPINTAGKSVLELRGGSAAGMTAVVDNVALREITPAPDTLTVQIVP